MLDNISRSDKLEDLISYYKAKLGREYKIAQHMWPRWDSQLKQDEEGEGEGEGSNSSYYKQKQKEKTSITIKKVGYKKGQKTVS